jgi:hypothetical protein
VLLQKSNRGWFVFGIKSNSLSVCTRMTEQKRNELTSGHKIVPMHAKQLERVRQSQKKEWRTASHCERQAE